MAALSPVRGTSVVKLAVGSWFGVPVRVGYRVTGLTLITDLGNTFCTEAAPHRGKCSEPPTPTKRPSVYDTMLHGARK